MVWQFYRDGSVPRWHDHPMLGRGRKPKKPIEALVLVPRKEWGAFPNEDEDPVDWPVNYVRVVDTRSEQCSTKSDCITLLQQMQVEQMRQGLPDIQWNFMIGSDGRVYEGRGWKFDATRSEELFEAIKEDCIDIAYIGKYEKHADVPEGMKDKVKSIIAHGVKHKYIDCCHRQVPYFNGTEEA